MACFIYRVLVSFNIGAQCLAAPEPDATSYLYADWDGNPVEFGTNISYKCEHGKKFDLDFDKPEEIATCLSGNDWKQPEKGQWPQCVESKACM